MLAAGLYLPLTAVLGGLLFARPEGYAEAQRDVIRLTADVEALRQQQGFITCEPLDPTEGGPLEPLPLHCSLLVIPAQVYNCHTLFSILSCALTQNRTKISNLSECLMHFCHTLNVCMSWQCPNGIPIQSSHTNHFILRDGMPVRCR